MRYKAIVFKNKMRPAICKKCDTFLKKMFFSRKDCLKYCKEVNKC